MNNEVFVKLTTEEETLAKKYAQELHDNKKRNGKFAAGVGSSGRG